MCMRCEQEVYSVTPYAITLRARLLGHFRMHASMNLFPWYLQSLIYLLWYYKDQWDWSQNTMQCHSPSHSWHQWSCRHLWQGVKGIWSSGQLAKTPCCCCKWHMSMVLDTQCATHFNCWTLMWLIYHSHAHNMWSSCSFVCVRTIYTPHLSQLNPSLFIDTTPSILWTYFVQHRRWCPGRKICLHVIWQFSLGQRMKASYVVAVFFGETGLVP